MKIHILKTRLKEMGMDNPKIPVRGHVDVNVTMVNTDGTEEKSLSDDRETLTQINEISLESANPLKEIYDGLRILADGLDRLEERIENLERKT